MKLKPLLLSLSTTIILSGCASFGKTDRIGKDDGSDLCFIYLDRLDEIAIYYKDERTKEIAVGAALGAVTGAVATSVAGGKDGAAIIGAVGGAVAGGLIADAYWKKTMQKANNKLTLATNFFESDIKSDVDKLSAADKDIANLVRCRTEQRDLIKRQYAQAILTTEQAQQEWKKWGDLIRRDREEMKYLGDALVNITKIEQSYTYAATAIEDPSYVTEEMQKKWQQELQLDHDKALVDAEQSYKGQIAKRGLTNKEKKTLKTEHEHKVSDLKNQFTTKQAAIKNKINPKDNPLKLLVASVHEKHESVQKNKENFDNLAIEAANNKGFEQINSGLSIQQQYAELNLPAWKFAFSGNR